MNSSTAMIVAGALIAVALLTNGYLDRAHREHERTVCWQDMAEIIGDEVDINTAEGRTALRQACINYGG